MVQERVPAPVSVGGDSLEGYGARQRADEDVAATAERGLAGHRNAEQPLAVRLLDRVGVRRAGGDDRYGADRVGVLGADVL